MNTKLTREVRDRSVAALRRAHAEGQKKADGEPWDGEGGVCSCVIIAEEFGIEIRAEDPVMLYAKIADLGFPMGGLGRIIPTIARINDARKSGLERRTFADVADVIETWDVVDGAEQICREASSCPV